MKDLYRHLCIDPSERQDVEAIRTAIEVCPDTHVSSVSKYILLTPQRKLVYDRYHQLLTTIGELKDELSVPSSMEWEALGCQDFDSEDSSPYDLGDLLETVSPTTTSAPEPSHRLRRQVHLYYDFSKLAVWGLGLLLAGILIITVLQLLTPSATVMPNNGWSTLHRTVDTNCYVDVRNPGPGNVALQVYSMSNQLIQTIVIHEGLYASCQVPEGEHRVEFSFGSHLDWDGKGFRSVKGARRMEPHYVKFSPNRKSRIRIPRQEP